VRLILVGGLPGTGKSTLAAGAGDALGATVLRSDEIRKELAGLTPTTPAGAPFGEGIYSPTSSARTYSTMLDRARIALGQGESVVIDASWSDEQRRDTARTVARWTSSELVEIFCTAPAEVAAERMRRRSAAGDDPSDATPVIAEAMAAVMAPWPEAIAVTTSGAPTTSLAQALHRLEVDDGA
jgi:predicted kinase